MATTIKDILTKEITRTKQHYLGNLDGRYQILLLKISVIEEIARVNPNILLTVIKAFEEADDWWQFGKNFTVEQWHERFVKLNETYE